MFKQCNTLGNTLRAHAPLRHDLEMTAKWQPILPPRAPSDLMNAIAAAIFNISADPTGKHKFS